MRQIELSFGQLLKLAIDGKTTALPVANGRVAQDGARRDFAPASGRGISWRLARVTYR